MELFVVLVANVKSYFVAFGINVSIEVADVKFFAPNWETICVPVLFMCFPM